MKKELYKFICDFCKNEFHLTHSNYIKRKATSRRTGYEKIVCPRQECRKKQRQEVIEIMLEKNRKNGTWDKIRILRKGKSYEDQYGVEKAKIIKEKVRQARLKQADPRLGKKNTTISKMKMREARLRYLEGHPDYAKEHAKAISNRYKNLPPEKKLRLSLMAQERGSQMKRYTKHGKMLTWYGEEVWYESTYERVYFEMLNNEKLWWKKNTSLLVEYYDTKYETLKYTKPDVLIYTANFETLTTILEIKPYEFLLNPKGRTGRYYQITNDKREGLVAYCKEYNLSMLFITELDLDEMLETSKDKLLFLQRKKKARAYENQFHKTLELYYSNREYFNGLRRFEVDGYILGNN